MRGRWGAEGGEMLALVARGKTNRRSRKVPGKWHIVKRGKWQNVENKRFFFSFQGLWRFGINLKIVILCAVVHMCSCLSWCLSWVWAFGRTPSAAPVSISPRLPSLGSAALFHLHPKTINTKRAHKVWLPSDLTGSETSLRGLFDMNGFRGLDTRIKNRWRWKETKYEAVNSYVCSKRWLWAWAFHDAPPLQLRST